MLKVMATCRGPSNEVVVPTLSGDPLLGESPHPTSMDVVGRAFDLKKAYKQLAIQPSMSRMAVIRVYDPASDGPFFFSGCARCHSAPATAFGFLGQSPGPWR